MRRLVHAILTHQHEQLQDDATALLIHWHPDTGATACANRIIPPMQAGGWLPHTLRRPLHRLRTALTRHHPAR
ncbi:hypothetical protein [Dactylosporangium sp. NPDC049140]|jgi:hypothetical protein|uniref:hypothetical protein n=1 Tax=Dactylosporangium sp. NPDC049140 TaxID=3155647 RepID=UPI0033E4D0F6